MNQVEFIKKAVLGDLAAEDFCRRVFNVSQVLDDLIDKDKPVTDDDIFNSFWECLIEIPKNPFYLKHAPTLVPMMQVFMVDYYDSVVLERAEKVNKQKNDHGKNIAFTLRDSIGSIITHCAYLVGGYQHMIEMSAEVRLVIFDESLENYKESLCQGAKAKQP